MSSITDTRNAQNCISWITVHNSSGCLTSFGDVEQTDLSGFGNRLAGIYLALVKRRIAVPQFVIFFNQLPDERQPIPRDGRDPFCEASGDGMVNYDLIL